MFKIKPFQLTILIVIILILTLVFSSASARVGGGHSYGGSSSSSSSGGGYSGGGGDGECIGEIIILLIRLLIWLIIEYPAIGIPLTIAIIVGFIYYKRSIDRPSAPSYVRSYTPPKKISPTEQIRRYKQRDPNFSKPLFVDFVQALYTKVYMTKGTDGWSALAPYLSRNILSELQNSSARSSDVVIGALNIIQISEEKSSDRIVVEIEANYREQKNSFTVVYYVREKWTFQRKKGVLSKGPEEISSLHCPSCGGAVELRPDGTCQYCNRVVTKGDFHWQLVTIVSVEKKPRPPLKIGGGGIEAGTDLPDVFQPNFDASKRAFMRRYPEFSPGEFANKVRNTFMNLQQAWSSGNWEMARPFETDYLFSTHRYWIDGYKADGLRNCLEDIEIISIKTVKIEQDAFYESITVRIKAKMKDYTIDKSGKVVDGSKTSVRTFSEYWTFIRRAGFASDKKEKKEGTCPNCGAPIDVNMAGICEYCNSKLTSGEFDWVLSSIEQDEAYEG